MLGSDFADALSDATLLGIGRHAKPHTRIPFEICDLTDPDKTEHWLSSFKPEWIIHAAAMTQVDLCESRQDDAFRNNVTATRNIALSARKHGAKVIFFSTDYIFDGKKTGEYEENDTPNPLSVYGKSKLEAEKVLQISGCQYLIFRISWLFGIRNRSFPEAILELASKEGEIPVVKDQIGRPTYSPDVALAISNLILHPTEKIKLSLNSIYHLANNDVTSWYDYAKLILKMSEIKDIRILPITSDELKRPAPRPANSVLSLKKCEKDLGIHLRPWQEALQDYLSELKRRKSYENQ